MQPVIVIAGPTASGKSSLAMDLAGRIGGDIINCDAMQVYRDLRVLTARPSAKDEAQIPHHLYGISLGDDQWSAGRYARAAAEAIEMVQGRGRVPIVVGGTGLWLKALLIGLSPMPEIPKEITEEAEARLAAQGMAAFRQEVLRDDPVLERLVPTDPQRHLRAWSVYRATGKPLSAWQALPPVPAYDGPFKGVALIPERDLLYERCAQRFDNMLAACAIGEVEALRRSGYAADAPILQALGVPELGQVITGTLTLEEAKDEAVRNTRRLAKRQSTWFRNQTPKLTEFDDSKDALVSLMA